MNLRWQAEKNAAISAVRRASKVCRTVQAGIRDNIAMTKTDRSPVTLADFASQAIICAVLSEKLPGDPVVGEEGTGQLRLAEQASIRKAMVERISEGMGVPVSEEQALRWIDLGGAEPSKLASGPEGKRYWTVDPIDGTKGFLRGDQYAVALALIIGGEVVVAALGCPNLTIGGIKGVITFAVKGQGAWMVPVDADDDATPIRIHAQTITNPSDANISEPVESDHSDAKSAAKVAKILNITAPSIRMDSQAKYAALAAGLVSIYLRLPKTAEYHEYIWDHAPGVLIVEEAGGRISDVSGRKLDFGRGKTLSGNRGIVGTCGAIHDAVIQAVGASV